MHLIVRFSFQMSIRAELARYQLLPWTKSTGNHSFSKKKQTNRLITRLAMYSPPSSTTKGGGTVH